MQSPLSQCREGRTCAPPTYNETLCAGGYYCRAGTLDGGRPCPTGIRPNAFILWWDLAAYCPPGLTTQFRGALSLSAVLRTGERFSFVCPTGKMCQNASVALDCPAAHFCARGARSPIPCSSDWFHPSAEARCPAGSIAEPGHAYAYILYLCLMAVPLWILLELLGLSLKWKAAARPLSAAPQRNIDDAKREFQMKHALGQGARSSVRSESSRRFPNLPSFRRQKSMQRCFSSLSRQRSNSGSGVPSSPRVLRKVPKGMERDLAAATVDELAWAGALTAEEAAAMPRDEGMRWALISLAHRSTRKLRPKSLQRFSPRGSAGDGVRSRAASDSEAHPGGDGVRSRAASDSEANPEAANMAEGKGPSLGELLGLPTQHVRMGTFINISIRGMDFYIGKSKILKGLHADAAQGQLITLMGESGSGKSTLLNILGGRSEYGQICASSPGQRPIFLNERPFDPKRVGSLIGFVPQAHIVFRELTVFENLAYAAQMRTAKSMSKEMRLVWNHPPHVAPCTRTCARVRLLTTHVPFVCCISA